jgi:alpha-ketoglutarate-dependent taurine dioxygenase
LRFPDQHLDLAALKRFSEQFGEIQGGGVPREPHHTREYPEIDILSNLKENGKYIGSPDAGQGWHTDMTYREVPGSAFRSATARRSAAQNSRICTLPMTRYRTRSRPGSTA